MTNFSLDALRTPVSMSALSIALMAAAPCAAQDMESADQTTASVAPAGLEDIVVTARKRNESLRDVPVAVAAVSGVQLASKNITQIVDLGSVTPNFQFAPATVQPLTFIRGFGSGINIGFAQSVAKFIDNVSFSRDQDGRIPLFDIERVEVLKGPQVLTFGNSATVGALSVITKKPGDSFEADGSASYEFNRNQVTLQGGITAPLADWASFRVAGLFDDLSHGQVYNVPQDRTEVTTRNWAVRPTLRLTPTSGLEIVLRGEYDHIRNFGNDIQAIGQPLKPGTLPFPEVDDKDTRYVDYTGGLVAAEDGVQMNARLFQADVNYEILGGTLTSTTAWRRYHSNVQFGVDGVNGAQTYWNALNQKYRQFSQELRFSGTYGMLDMTVGGFYQNDTLHANVIQAFQLGGLGLTGLAATPFGRTTYFDQRIKTYSAFTDLTYHLTDQLSIGAGIRYSHYKKTAGQGMFGHSIVPGVGFNTTREDMLAANTPYYDDLQQTILRSVAHQLPFGSVRLKETHWQPQALVQYKFAPRNMIYAKFVKGQKVGGFDYSWAATTPTTSAGSIAFGPEKAVSFEVGMKGLILDNTLDYSINLFRTTFTALQASSYQNFANLIRNVGKARSQGVEIDLTYAPIDGLRLGFSGSYLDAKYVDFQNAPCTSIQNISACTSQDISGERTPFGSEWTGNFSVDYQYELNSGYIVGGGASVFARTKYNVGTYNDPRMIAHGSAQLDAHLDLKKSDGLWTASLFGRNLTDVRNLEHGVLVPGQSSAVVGTYARGRQIGVRLGFNLQ